MQLFGNGCLCSYDRKILNLEFSRKIAPAAHGLSVPILDRHLWQCERVAIAMVVMGCGFAFEPCLDVVLSRMAMV